MSNPLGQEGQRQDGHDHHEHHDHHDHDHDHDHDHHHHAHDDHEPTRDGQSHRGHQHGSHQHGSHGHHHLPADFGRAFAVGISLNLVFVVIEAIVGWRASSLALLADAAHNLSDVAGLVLAWVAILVAKRSPTRRFTYGLQRGSIIASFINAVILLMAMGSLAWEAQPESFDAISVMAVAAAGVVVNGFTAWMFMSGSRDDINIRGAFLHMLSDALVSVGVIFSSAIFLWKGWMWIDPLVSLLIALIIVGGTWSLFKQSLHLMFDGVPAHIDVDKISMALRQLPNVSAVHDVHVWAVATSKVALTAHLVVREDPVGGDDLLIRAHETLKSRCGIEHATLQVESMAYSKGCHDCAGGLL